MPEGVEVKLSAELIRPLVIDKKIINLYAGSNSRYKSTPVEGLKEFIDSISSHRVPTSIKEVNVKGKFMYWTFTNEKDEWYMLCTFGMSGQWSPKEGKHPCFIFEFNDNSKIYFNDPRHFGTIKFTNNKQDLIDKLNELGWDPLQDKFEDYKEFLTSTIKKSNKSIGQLLMDQSIFAGVGNYIRAEALYLSKMSPWGQGSLMTDDQIKNLCDSIIQVMEESYKYQGATIHTYKTVYGEEGKYSSCFKVYGQKKDPLGNKIIKEKTPDGRTIHWCPAIQK